MYFSCNEYNHNYVLNIDNLNTDTSSENIIEIMNTDTY